MVDKPKTYAQQNQDLKDELAQKDELLKTYENLDALTQQKDREISELQSQLAAYQSAAQQAGVSDKSQLTDAIQRAESAEQGLRNLQSHTRELEAVNESLQTQVRTIAIERDKEVGKDKKLIELEEIIRAQNFSIEGYKRRIREVDEQKDNRIAALEREVRNLRMVAETRTRDLDDMKQRISEFNLIKSLGY
jgi:DNA repair exonuclease SbcCD ATPase subunit